MAQPCIGSSASVFRIKGPRSPAQGLSVWSRSLTSVTDRSIDENTRPLVRSHFQNLTDPENEFFADGVTEEIINALAQIKELHVVARSSACTLCSMSLHSGWITGKKPNSFLFAENRGTTCELQFERQPRSVRASKCLDSVLTIDCPACRMGLHG